MIFSRPLSLDIFLKRQEIKEVPKLIIDFSTAKTRSNSGGPRFPNVQNAGISKPAGTEFREGIFDLAPTLVKSVVSTLMTRRNWHLL